MISLSIPTGVRRAHPHNRVVEQGTDSRIELERIKVHFLFIYIYEYMRVTRNLLQRDDLVVTCSKNTLLPILGNKNDAV